jgi:hypothetical protein
MDDVFADLNDGSDERRFADTCAIVSAPSLHTRVTCVNATKYSPVSPATIILNLPMALPLFVKGLLVGICILGITSCGKPEAACWVSECSSSSPLEATA